MNKEIDLVNDKTVKRFPMMAPQKLYISGGCALVLWKLREVRDEDEEEFLEACSESMQDIKSDILAYMLGCDQILKDYQQHFPVVALLVSPDELMFRVLEGQQDWHRGRFIVSSVSHEEHHNVLNRWCDAADASQYQVKKVDSTEFLQLVLSRKSLLQGARKVDQELLRFADIIEKQLRDGNSEKTVAIWESDLREKINHLAKAEIV